jgi:hypothetical protein
MVKLRNVISLMEDEFSCLAVFYPVAGEFSMKSGMGCAARREIKQQWGASREIAPLLALCPSDSGGL